MLLDSRATHSIISSLFAMNIGRRLEPMRDELFISTLVGYMLVVEHVYRDCMVEIDKMNMLIDLLPLELQEFM